MFNCNIFSSNIPPGKCFTKSTSTVTSVHTSKQYHNSKAHKYISSDIKLLMYAKMMLTKTLHTSYKPALYFHV